MLKEKQQMPGKEIIVLGFDAPLGLEKESQIVEIDRETDQAQSSNDNIEIESDTKSKKDGINVSITNKEDEVSNAKTKEDPAQTTIVQVLKMDKERLKQEKERQRKAEKNKKKKEQKRQRKEEKRLEKKRRKEFYESPLGILPDYIPENDSRLNKRPTTDVFNLEALFSGLSSFVSYILAQSESYSLFYKPYFG